MLSMATLVTSLKGANLLGFAGVTSETYRQNWLAFVKARSPTEDVSAVWMAAIIMAGAVTTRKHRFLKVLQSIVEQGEAAEQENLRSLLKLMEKTVDDEGQAIKTPIKSIGNAFPDLAIPALYGNALGFYATAGERISDKLMFMLMLGNQLLMHCLHRDCSMKVVSVLINAIYWTRVVKKSFVFVMDARVAPLLRRGGGSQWKEYGLNSGKDLK